MYYKKKGTHIFINLRMIRLCCIFALGILFIAAIMMIPPEADESSLLGYILLSVFSIMFVATIIFMPHSCELNETGVKISYIFGLKETAKWNQIRKIKQYAVDKIISH